MNKTIWLVIILGVIIVILLGAFFILPGKKADNPPVQNQEGLVINSPKSGEVVSSPLEITGVTSGWNGFEGQAGTVQLLDFKGIKLATGVLQATTDWTKPPVNFKATLTFDAKTEGPATLVFRNENPSGLSANDKTFTLPIRIKQSNTMVVKAFFNNSKMDPESSCNKVFAVERQVPKTEAVARAALDELLKGLTDAEKTAGFFTSINSGVKIQSLTIENGVAKVDFDEQLQFQVGGSCKVSAIRAQITETLKQFSTVKSVIISIDGRTEDILQP